MTVETQAEALAPSHSECLETRHCGSLAYRAVGYLPDRARRQVLVLVWHSVRAQTSPHVSVSLLGWVAACCAPRPESVWRTAVTFPFGLPSGTVQDAAFLRALSARLRLRGTCQSWGQTAQSRQHVSLTHEYHHNSCPRRKTASTYI